MHLTSIIFKKIFWFCLVLAVNCNDKYAFHMFENHEGCRRIMNSEIELVKTLRYLRQQLVRHRATIGKFSDFNNSTLINTLKIGKEYESKFNSQDYQGALRGFVFLHDTYDFNVLGTTSGEINYIDSHHREQSFRSLEKIKSQDLLNLSKMAYSEHNYDRAVQFMTAFNRNWPNLVKKNTHKSFTKKLMKINNEIFSKFGAKKQTMTADHKILPFFLDSNLDPKKNQPEFANIDWKIIEDSGYTRPPKSHGYFEKRVCSQGYVVKSKDSIFWGKCVLYHYNDPYLKLGPFSVEISNADPPRFVLHKLFSENEINWMVEYSKPRLSEKRDNHLRDQYQINEKVGEKGKKRIVLKTVQTWFQDVLFHDNGEKEVLIPVIEKLTKRLELATQMQVAKNTSSTDYQTTNYGLGGLCESHTDPYGYIQGTPLHDNPQYLGLKVTGDILGTVMGWLNKVGSGGGTAFMQVFQEQLIEPTIGSAAFWYSLDAKGHILKSSIHYGCPVLEGSKWIVNKWIFYYDQWKKFPCRLDPSASYSIPSGFY